MILNLNGALWSRKVMLFIIKKWRHYLEDAEILLKSDAKSLQKFLNGKTDNLKLDRWSLELQGRNITDTKTLQQEDRYFIRKAKILSDPKSRFYEKDSYGYNEKEILTEKMVGSTKQQWYQSFLFKQYSKKCMIILAILVLERLTH